MVRSEQTPIPVGKQQLVTCGRGPKQQHRGHLCKSCDLNAPVSLPQCSRSKQKEVFLSMDQSSPKEDWKSHPGITWDWSYLVLFAQLRHHVEGIKMSWVPLGGFHQFSVKRWGPEPWTFAWLVNEESRMLLGNYILRGRKICPKSGSHKLLN